MTLICTATKRFWLYQQEQDNLHGQEAFKVYRNNSTDTLLTSIAHCELGEGTELRESKHETIMHKFNDKRFVNIVIIFLVRLIARLVLSDCSTNVKSKAYTTLVCPLKYACSVSSSETGHVAAARKRSHQWCVSLTPNNTKTMGRMTCHCFQRPIRRDLTSSSYTTVGDPGAVSRVGGKAGRKCSNTGEKAPGYRLSPNYFQKFKRVPTPDWAQKMLCIIVHNRRTVSPEFFFASSYTTAIVSTTACLAYAPKKCTQSGNFQFDIKSASDFKILSAQKLTTLFQNTSLSLPQVFTLASVTSCANIREFLKIPRRLTTTKTSHEKGNSYFSVSIVVIPTRVLCQMQPNSSGAEFLSTISKFMKRMDFVIACLRSSQNMKLGIFTGSRAVDGKEMYKKNVMHEQSCCFILSIYCLSDFLVAAASLTSYYLRYIVMSN